VIANIGTKGTALQRYKSERDAAMAWVKHLEVSGGAIKEEWLEFSERIRFAAERLTRSGKTRVEIVRLEGFTIGRFIFEPGWRWSECVKPAVGTRAAKSVMSVMPCPAA